MTTAPIAVMIDHRAAAKLWTVQCFIALISGSERLVPGEGLRRLQMMSSGLNTYNDDDIKAAAAKADAEGYFVDGLHGFMMQSIVKNCQIYAMMLQQMLECRIRDISTGAVSNPTSGINRSDPRIRRSYYIPQFTFIQKIQKALNSDFSGSSDSVVKLCDLANEAEFILTQLQGRDGYVDPQPNCFSTLVDVVRRLVSNIDVEHMGMNSGLSLDYKNHARPSLKLVWFITKLIMGDLSVIPSREHIAVVDLESRLKFSDATLACIPFPTPQTVSLFSEPEVVGVSLKGRTYLAAASMAAFNHNNYPDNQPSGLMTVGH